MVVLDIMGFDSFFLMGFGGWCVSGDYGCCGWWHDWLWWLLVVVSVFVGGGD